MMECEFRWWRDPKSINGNSEGEKWFNKNFRWNVGKGNKNALKEVYPRIYANSIHKSLKIEECGEWQGQIWI